MKEIFDEILATFENDDIKEFAKKCIDAAPPYFFQVPASSTYKYHPRYACETPLGLAKHTVAVVLMLNYFFDIESIRNEFTSRERDLLRVAGIVHDMMKSGSQKEYEKSKWTKFDHPLLASKLVQDVDGLTKTEKVWIGAVVSSHMGAWNEDKRHPDIKLPKPSNKYQIILHTADYLASRKRLEVQFDNTIAAEKIDLTPDVKTWQVPYGKYTGKTLAEINEVNPGYIEWAAKNIEKEPDRTLFSDFLKTEEYDGRGKR